MSITINHIWSHWVVVKWNYSPQTNSLRTPKTKDRRWVIQYEWPSSCLITNTVISLLMTVSCFELLLFCRLKRSHWLSDRRSTWLTSDFWIRQAKKSTSRSKCCSSSKRYRNVKIVYVVFLFLSGSNAPADFRQMLLSITISAPFVATFWFIATG